MATNPSSNGALGRLKKSPPPPLVLPKRITAMDDQNIPNSTEQYEQKKSQDSYCSSSSSKDCTHRSIPYTLPTNQRSQILEILTASSSTLLLPPVSETKNKKSGSGTHANPINLLKQCQSSSNFTATDGACIDFIRSLIHKSFETELISLLDKYKTTYFDRLYAPNTTDNTIRSSLCDMASEALVKYSSDSTLSQVIRRNQTTNISCSIPTTNIKNTNITKRKRKTSTSNLCTSAPLTVNKQTKFVISYIIPGQYDNYNNGNKMVHQQQQLRQFHKKYSHLFKYIPDKDELENLKREGRWTTSSHFISNNRNICLMLHDEVVNYMEKYDLELSGISIDDSFTLPGSILARIH